MSRDREPATLPKIVDAVQQEDEDENDGDDSDGDGDEEASYCIPGRLSAFAMLAKC